jgi:hypothetical protein
VRCELGDLQTAYLRARGLSPLGAAEGAGSPSPVRNISKSITPMPRYRAIGSGPFACSAIADTCAREPVGAHVAKFDRKAVAKVVVHDARKPQRRRLFGPPPARLGLFAPSHTPQKARWSVLLVTRHRPSPGRFESHQRAVVQIGSVASPRMRR